VLFVDLDSQRRRWLMTVAHATVAALAAVSPTNPLGEQRPYYWAVAWHEYQAHPPLGSVPEPLCS
jgi:hypothetical protein